MRETHYIDHEGRYWCVLLPDDAPESDAPKGIPVGPPSLEALGLPAATEIRLHNQLYARGIFTERDARRRVQDLQAALSAAFRVDANIIADLYATTGMDT